MDKIKTIKSKYDLIKGEFNERARRLWAASEAIALGYGGIAVVHKATGISRSTIRIGKEELLTQNYKKNEAGSGRVRKPGGGRKRLEQKESRLIEELEKLVEPGTRGDPESPLRWTTKSTRNLANALKVNDFTVSHVKIASLLGELGYSLQAPRKTNEGKSHADRDGQFNYINAQTIEFQKQGLPVISVDAKKKELVGSFTNVGKEYQPSKSPVEVNAYDFLSFADGKATPYGVYDISKNSGWVNIGMSKDTAQFAVATIRHWWFEMGKQLYPEAKKLLIHADGGGSNGHRNRLWKMEIQKFANEAGLEITISHFPPGTSKWNKIEHRLFAQISKNWRGRPLESFAVIVELIGSTTTSTGLTVKANIDTDEYKTGIKISDSEFKRINIIRHEFHGDNWNYTITPNLV